jgi:CheY-like chemotaxis protein
MRILVVDDRDVIAQSTVDFLREFLAGKNDVIKAKSGVEALAILQSTPNIDLVVTDQEMRPGINGDELTVQIKERFKIPVVLWSTNALPVGHRADFSLLKPDTDALLAIIEELKKSNKKRAA